MGERVADFGCGSGQLAKMLVDTGKEFVFGIDFSPIAIKMALEMNPNLRGKFSVGSLYQRLAYEIIPFDCAIFCEVLEHLEHDRTVLNFLPDGCHVIFTVPNYLTGQHVRAFRDVEAIRDRYEEFVEIASISPVMMNEKEDWKIWVVDGRKR